MWLLVAVKSLGVFTKIHAIQEVKFGANRYLENCVCKLLEKKRFLLKLKQQNLKRNTEICRYVYDSLLHFFVTQ